MDGSSIDEIWMPAEWRRSAAATPTDWRTDRYDALNTTAIQTVRSKATVSGKRTRSGASRWSIVLGKWASGWFRSKAIVLWDAARVKYKNQMTGISSFDRLF